MHRVYYETMVNDSKSFVTSIKEAKSEMTSDPENALYFGSKASFLDDEDVVALNLVDALYGYFAFGLAKVTKIYKF